jgi:hypothetical protein
MFPGAEQTERFQWIRRCRADATKQNAKRSTYFGEARPLFPCAFTKGAIMSLATRVLTIAAAAGILMLALGNGDRAPAGASETRNADVAAVHWKDQARVAQAPPEFDAAGLLTQLAQASGPAGVLPGPTQHMPPPPLPPHGVGAAGPFGPPPEPPFFAGPRPMMSRIACETRLDLQAGMAGYLASRLRLTDEQRQAWRKVEDMAQPAIAKLHAACDRLPRGPGEALNVPDELDVLEAQASARLDLVRATHGPLLALYQMLTPDQRAELHSAAPMQMPMR